MSENGRAPVYTSLHLRREQMASAQPERGGHAVRSRRSRYSEPQQLLAAADTTGLSQITESAAGLQRRDARGPSTLFLP